MGTCPQVGQEPPKSSQPKVPPPPSMVPSLSQEGCRREWRKVWTPGTSLPLQAGPSRAHLSVLSLQPGCAGGTLIRSPRQAGAAAHPSHLGGWGGPGQEAPASQGRGGCQTPDQVFPEAQGAQGYSQALTKPRPHLLRPLRGRGGGGGVIRTHSCREEELAPGQWESLARADTAGSSETLPRQPCSGQGAGAVRGSRGPPAA